MLGVAQSSIVQAINTALGGEDISYLHTGNNKYPLPIRLELNESDKVELNQLLVMKVRAADSRFIALSDLVHVRKGIAEKTICHKNLQPVVFVTADMAGELDSPLYGLFSIAFGMADAGMNWQQMYIQQPPLTDDISMKWNDEWQITYETFHDMGIAYGVSMILIYLLVVGQFRSYLVPLIIMAPIPLTIIGVMPGHALFGAQFTATSMIGMIGAFFTLNDPIFNGLAISLIFGILVSTLLTLVIIPLLYFAAFRKTFSTRA